MAMLPLLALVSHAELSGSKRQSKKNLEARSSPRAGRFGNLTLHPRTAQMWPIDQRQHASSIVASLSNVSESGLGLIHCDPMAVGSEFDVDWPQAGDDRRPRFVVVHSRPMGAGMHRSGARLIAGAIPRAAIAGASKASKPLLSLVKSEPPNSNQVQRLDGVTVCGWERQLEISQAGNRMWIYIHSPGKKNGWGIFVDAESFESAQRSVRETGEMNPSGRSAA